MFISRKIVYISAHVNTGNYAAAEIIVHCVSELLVIVYTKSLVFISLLNRPFFLWQTIIIAKHFKSRFKMVFNKFRASFALQCALQNTSQIDLHNKFPTSTETFHIKYAHALAAPSRCKTQKMRGCVSFFSGVRLTTNFHWCVDKDGYFIRFGDSVCAF